MTEYSKDFHALCTKLAKDLIDRGLLMRAGAKTLLSLELPVDKDEALRYAFYAGADHLFMTVMNVLDEGKEPTEQDIRYMELITDELDEWRKTARAVLESSPKGHA